MLNLHGARGIEGIPQATAVAIGMFDGVHCAHQALIRRTRHLAEQRGLEPLVLTLDRHTDEILHPEKARPYLTLLPEKVAAIRALGISLVVVARVTPAFLAIRAREFVARCLVGELHARAVVVGPDFRFGHRREGDVSLLEAMQTECGFTLEVCEPVYADDEKISSTLIRRTLAAGNVEAATALLSRPYQLSGQVVPGDEIGRAIGFPTANIAYPAQKILPALGVYLCQARVGGDCYGAAVNVGRRPTFDGTRITVEAHLLDFSGDLYGQTITLEFLHRLRAEQKFPDADALRAQVAADVDRARALFPGCGKPAE